MSTYLSLDLDYWGLTGHDRYMLPFVKRVMSLGVPTMLVTHHHWLLPHINRHRATRLINMDYHDDIVIREKQVAGGSMRFVSMVEEGSWGSYVKWREGAWFQWVHPHRREDNVLGGYCEVMGYG